MAERVGFEPPVRFYPYNGLANRFAAFWGVVTELPISCFSALNNKVVYPENKKSLESTYTGVDPHYSLLTTENSRRIGDDFRICFLYRR